MKAHYALLCFGLLGCGDDTWVASARAASASPSAASAPSASSSTLASPSASTEATPVASGSASTASAGPKSFHDHPPSGPPTKAPTAAEWTSAEEVKAFRDRTGDCQLKRRDEWVRIFCDHSPFATSLVTGSRDGVSIREITEGDKTGTVLTFPVRRGDRRVFLLFSQTKWSGSASIHISEQWLESDSGPYIGIY